MCRGVSHTPFIAANNHSHNNDRQYAPANNTLFANVRAYAIRPYSFSIDFKPRNPRKHIENWSYRIPSQPNKCRGVSHTPFTAANTLSFDEISYHLAANNTLFAKMRAYVIRPYSFSIDFKQLNQQKHIYNWSYRINSQTNMCRGVSHTPFTAANTLSFDEFSYHSATNNT